MASKELVQRLVTETSFDDTGTLREEGHIGLFKPENAEEKHMADVGSYQVPVVEMSAIAPTGPNPKLPQQIPPDGGQGPGGGYEAPGQVLVAEVTAPAEERLAEISTPEEEAKATEILEDAKAKLLDDNAAADAKEAKAAKKSSPAAETSAK